MSMIEKGEIEGCDDTKKEWYYTLEHGFSELRKEDLTEVDHVVSKFFEKYCVCVLSSWCLQFCLQGCLNVP